MEHKNLISECNKTVSLLLTLIVKQHGELDTQTRLVEELSKARSSCTEVNTPERLVEESEVEAVHRPSKPDLETRMVDKQSRAQTVGTVPFEVLDADSQAPKLVEPSSGVQSVPVYVPTESAASSVVAPKVLRIIGADVESNSVLVTWESNGQETNKYLIKCNGISDSKQVEVDLKDIHCTDNCCSTRIIRLKPWEKYYLQVCAENGAGRGEWSKPYEIVLNKSPPPKPTKVSVNLIKDPETESVKLQLDIKQPTLCEPVEEYRLIYLSEGGEPDIYTDKVDQTYNTTFIIPVRETNFKSLHFFVKNECGWSLPSDIIHASNLEPGKVQTFAYNIDTDSVELMWEEASTNSAIVEGYELEWQMSKETKRTKEMFHIVPNLHPDTEYCFRVFPLTKFGKRGESSKELVIKTKPVVTGIHVNL